MSSSVAGPSKQPLKPPVVQPGSGNAVIINPCQRLNPLLECIRNVSKEFGDIVPDFQLGRTTCALFLSLKYHRLHPEYIHQRIQKLGHLFMLRLLILMCDVNEHQELIRELTRICVVNNITIVVCWSNEEAGAYLSTYKAFEHKPPDLIKERVDKEYNAMLRAALTSINKVNKTDVETLRTSFGSFAKIAHATPEELRRLPGFGQVKVKRIVDAFEKPFRNKATSTLPSQAQARLQLQAENDIAQQDEQELLAAEPHTENKAERRDDMDATNISNQAQAQGQNGKTPTSASAPSKHVHDFGSAADMPTPPTPSAPRAREPSPVWDIELDLTEDDFRKLDEDVGRTMAHIDPRLAKKAIGAESIHDADKTGNFSADLEGEATISSTQNVTGSSIQQRVRSPSPVWDIELDLNDDDM